MNLAKGVFDPPIMVDMAMVTLSIEIRFVLTFGVGRFRFDLFNMRIIGLSSDPINRAIIDRTRIESDGSPPEFSEFSDSVATRKKRQTTGTTHCTVFQLKGLDYTEPAFQLEFAANDNAGDIELSLNIGTSPFGADVRNIPLGINSVTMHENLPAGRQLFFTVLATNSEGLVARATCGIHSYNKSPPYGQVAADYLTTSNPTVMHGSTMIIDESPTVINMAALGQGRGVRGDQVINWHDVSYFHPPPPPVDPRGINSLEHFNNAIRGRLTYEPFRVLTLGSSLLCAIECLGYKAVLCQSFHYDYGESRRCELVRAIEGTRIHVHRHGNVFYYERRGLGHVSTLEFDISLRHNNLYYVNAYAENTLGYTNEITAVGTLVDLTTPSPRDVTTMAEDVLMHLPCEEFIIHHLRSRCVGQTPIDNYWYFKDGNETRTIFNGPHPLVEQTYTRANRMISANWDGIHDNETGILIYEFAVGLEPCSHTHLPHQDPHGHLHSSDQWTHVGVMYPVFMQDGEYYITVQALNDIEFGGPLAVAVCHSIPYTVDTVPPIIISITDYQYDEALLEVSLALKAIDETFRINRVEFGLGNDRRNVYVMPYTDVYDFENPAHNFELPYGIFVWGKIRVTDMVGLRAVDHSEAPIIVDFSPPEPGTVYDGHVRGRDLHYQNSSNSYCGIWDGFTDPESGIAFYVVELGSESGGNDVAQKDVSSRDRSWCMNELNLTHRGTYYLTVTAWNGAAQPRNTSVTSSGVYVDVTPPDPGWVRDGRDRYEDEMYSRYPATLSATFDNFTDPDSGIQYYFADVYQKPDGGMESKVHTETNIEQKTDHLVMHHLHFQHRDTVRTEITAVNRAKGQVTVPSSGFFVDLTIPMLEGLVDGMDLAYDPQFSPSVTDLSVSWIFADPESGIHHYDITVFQLFQGQRTLFYPESGAIRLLGNATRYEGTEFDLTPGLHYSFRVSATNGAGLRAVHDTTGVVIDPTPPIMRFVRAGALLGQFEEVMGDVVVHNDPHHLPASWKAEDFESGIIDYQLAIGSRQGGEDVLPFQSMGTSQETILTDLSLEMYSESGKLYYISVIAVNGAGTESALEYSSPIRVVAADVAGITLDGPKRNIDIDYKIGTSTLTATFSGFESEANGIHEVEFSVGTRPGWDNIVPFSRQGIIVHDDEEKFTMGMGGDGEFQTLVPLSPGERFHVNIRAVTGAGNILESSSDGVTVDVTSPTIGFTSLLSYRNAELEAPIYTTTVDPFAASWNVTDAESHVESTHVFMGTYTGGRDVFPELSTAGADSLPNGQIHVPVKDGVPVFLSLEANNNVGLTSLLSSHDVIPDSSPPLEGVVSCPRHLMQFDTEFEFECHWNDFRDDESGVDGYKVALGVFEEDESIVSYQSLPPGQTSIVFSNAHLDLNLTSSLVATVIGINKAGGETAAFSSPLIFDDTPPLPGYVIEISDTAWINETNDWTAFVQHDVTCQRSLSQITVAWGGFFDEESSISLYQLGLGTTPGGRDIHPFVDVSTERFWLTLTDLDLTNVAEVFATIQAYNGVGLFTSTSSDGVFISRVSSGLKQFQPDKVNDGSMMGTDRRYQVENTGLYANWDFTGDPCPINNYQWEVWSFQGELMHQNNHVPGGQNLGMVDDIMLETGQSFYSVVTATNMLGFSRSARSDGIIINLEPMVPGNVRDGDIIGTDLNFWPHADHLSANWDGFGAEHIGANPDEMMNHQIVDFYEVAAGTDRRFAEGRENIHPFVNVGLNTTVTFKHLHLLPEVGIYIITVRAYSIAGSMAEAMSNGMRVGFDVVKGDGEITINRFLDSSSHVPFSWKHFLLAFPIQHYMWSMGTWTEAIADSNCSDLIRGVETTEHMSDIFDVVRQTNVGFDTSVDVTNLNLQHGEDYFVSVIGVDMAGECIMAYELFTVDITPPFIGQLTVGAVTERDLWYNPSLDEMRVEWENFEDPESDIDSFTLTIHESATCLSRLNEYRPLIGPIILSHNETQHMMFNLKINTDASYRAELVATNRAGLNTTVMSPRILIDTKAPSPGYVKDGTSFKTDRSFQSSNTEMTGTLIYAPGQVNPCPPRDPLRLQTFDIIDGGKVVDILNSEYLIDIPIHKNMVEMNDNLNLRLERDVRYTNMRSGAISIPDPQMSNGRYGFLMETGLAEFWPVTTVIFSMGCEAEALCDLIKLQDTRFNMTDNQTFTFNEPEYIDLEEFSENVTFQSGFGFQIRSGHMDNITIHYLRFWALVRDSRTFEEVELEIDPSADFHSYELIVNQGGARDSGPWDIVLRLDNLDVLGLSGVNPILSSDDLHPRVQVGIYPSDGYTVPLDDMFDPPLTATIIQQIWMPSEADDLCRYGEPFIRGDAPLMEIWAGVGTSREKTGIQEEVLVASLCVPCLRECDRAICDEDCNPDIIQEISFSVDGLNIETFANTTNNETMLQPYYLTVFARAGSGLEAKISSDGVYVDSTPPVITLIQHMDDAWENPQQPVDFQGNNHTISVYWEAEDLESWVVEYEWAIGSTPWATDIQDFVSVGKQTSAKNTDLYGILEDETTYYVTVRAYNGAGLWTEKNSTGVTVWLFIPNMSDLLTDLEGTVELPEDILGNAVQSERPDQIHIGWDQPDADEEVFITLMAMESDTQEENLLPPIPVGLNESGYIEMDESGLHIKGADYDQYEAHHRVKREAGWGSVNVEPGRPITTNLRCCTAAHVCGPVPVKDMLYMRDDDILATSYNESFQTDLGKAFIQPFSAQLNGKSLVAGTLTLEDTQIPYSFVVESTFRPYIVDLLMTSNKTNRIMYNRIVEWDSNKFFIATMPKEPIFDGLNLSATFNTTLYQQWIHGEYGPRILAWCPDDEFWVDASRSCPAGDINEDWDNNTIATRVCNIAIACKEGKSYVADHTKPNVAGPLDYYGPTFFAVAKIKRTLHNSPPFITSVDTFYMDEDSGTGKFLLTAEDPDGDDLIFKLTPGQTHPGKAELSRRGTLRYTPPVNFFGPVVIGVEAMEDHIFEDMTVLSAEANITIIVRAVNDLPVLMLVHKGFDKVPPSYVIDHTVEQSHHVDELLPHSFLIVAYDVDEGDEVTIHFNLPYSGTTQQSPTVRDVHLVEQDCSRPWSTRTPAWEQMVTDLWAGVSPLTKPVVCNINPHALIPRTAWVVSEVLWTPEYVGYYGTNTLMVIAEDQHEARSDLLRNHIHVLEFPCLNNATCLGPVSDPNCDGPGRAKGFHAGGYRCMCAQDFTGKDCETEIDNCLSNPCPYNYTCTDGVGYYTCTCDSTWWPCSDELLPWELALIIGFPLLIIIATIVVVMFLYIRSQSMKNKVGDSTVRLQDAEEDNKSVKSFLPWSNYNKVSPSTEEILPVENDSGNDEDSTTVEIDEPLPMQTELTDNEEDLVEPVLPEEIVQPTDASSNDDPSSPDTDIPTDETPESTSPRPVSATSDTSLISIGNQAPSAKEKSRYGKSTFAMMTGSLFGDAPTKREKELRAKPVKSGHK